MYTIEICDEKGIKLLEYKNSILPMAGDDYAGINFKDGKMREVINRLLFTHEGGTRISVNTKIKFPSLYSN